MRNILIFTCLLLLLIVLTGLEQSRIADRPTTPVADSCMACHILKGAPFSAAHDVKAMGCSPCHLGNGQAYDKDRAHYGMVNNPGDLRVVDSTCGRSGCHPPVATRVKTSVMATAAGMLGALDDLWDTGGPRDAVLLWAEDAPRDPPRDYWAKLCAACHLWWPKGRGLGEQRLRGGGCSACHVVGPQAPPLDNAGEFHHARLTMVVPMDNCIRCHNRSARIGLSYRGLAEDDGAGGPHAAGALNPLRLSGWRFAKRIEPDVHFSAGMTCIDCHTGAELMGDGTVHPRLREQLDVACTDCHAPRFLTTDAAQPHPATHDTQAMKIRAEGKRLTALNPALPPLGDAPLAHTAAKGTPLYALRLKALPHEGEPGRAELLRKADGNLLPITLHAQPKPHHALRGHERLSCQACHSPLMPQCYGCHVTLDTTEEQTDMLLGRKTPGRWAERLDYSRLRQPALAIRGGTRMAPFSPCQVQVITTGSNGDPIRSKSRTGVTMTPFDPHTTRTRSRTCLDCHLLSKTLDATEMIELEASGLPFDLSSDAQGPQTTTTRPKNSFPGIGDRALNQDERAAALSVAPCLPCHSSYSDTVYHNFRAARIKLRTGGAPRCQCPETARPKVEGITVSNRTH